MGAWEIILRASISQEATAGDDDPVKGIAEEGIGIRMIRGLHIARQVPRTQESERGTEKQALCDFSSHAAILSVPSFSLPTKLRAGGAEGELSEETGKGG